MLTFQANGCRYIISRFWTHTPVILTHSVTSACNCRCKICNIWKKKPSRGELSTDEVRRMLDEARRMNFVAYVAWGGEPLMRLDILEILRYAHALGFYTSIITNGTMLKDMAGEIAKVVDLTWVSLDCDSAFHSEMRGVEGIFEKALEGIRELKSKRGRIAINCVLSKLNADVVPRMGELAKRCGVKLAFDPMHVFPEANAQYALSPSQRRQAFSEAAELKEKGYPILNSYEYLQKQTNLSYSCAQPRIFVDVSEDGKVKPFWCAKSNSELGDLRRQSLGEIVHSKPFKEFVDVSKGCSLCSHSTTFETSIFYSVKRFLANLYRPNSPYLKFLMDFALT